MQSLRNTLTMVCCVLFLTASPGQTETELGQLCRYAAETGGKTIKLRRHAPDRKADVLHLTIDVTPDFTAQTVSGKTSIRFKPIALPLKTLRLDAVDLTVQTVTSTTKIRGYDVTDEAIWVTFEKAIPPKMEVTVTVVYEAEPKKGLYFRTPEMGYKPEDEHLWTQGETHEARHWFPSYDYPNEKFTSEVICHVPKDMVVLSNGRQVSATMDSETGLKSVQWLQNKPHVNYLIALTAGKFKHVSGKYQNIPLGFYTPASQIAQAQNSFALTTDMMAFFEQEIGVPYPWDQYNQVVVDDFPWGGMENTTLTVLTDGTLFTEASENIRSSQGLVAHELAHQWFGDYVTCKDWSQVWLNEGFATYYEHLYAGYKDGQDALLYKLYKDARGITRRKGNRPMVDKTYNEGATDQFDYRAYSKGSWVLHMLRTQLGEDLFRRCIKTYLERHAFQTVVTEDLNRILEELSGRSFDAFFDQYVYHGQQPELNIKYSWNEKDGLAKVTVTQKQETNEKVLLFSFPTKIRFKTKSSVVDHEVVIYKKQHDFYFPLTEAPEIVRFDPDYGVLAKLTFNKPRVMLYKQLTATTDVIGRLMAVASLKSKKDQKTVDQLKAVLNGDPFYGVRIEASVALRSIHTPNAFDALATSANQQDARVRRQVVRDLGRFYKRESLTATQKVIATEKNPDILTEAIRNLGKYPSSSTRKTLLDYLNSESYRNRLAYASVQAIRTMDDPDYIPDLQKTLKTQHKAFPSGTFGRSLDALAYLARNEDNRKKLRLFLAGYLEDDRKTIRRWAVTALGTLRDPAAIPLVSTFVGAGEDAVEKAAEGALKSLRENNKGSVEMKDLRNEVLKLKEKNEKMEKDLADIRKRMDAKDQKKKDLPSENTKDEK
ncbi:MAG: M1 family metallopeptidase [Candidatus Latescibacteria bacterium]|jgi:aminopeptidase N|nr:M1 family metallopeptidase [Candidatus Latescibacterota bacterium]MBT4140386.1 M1 family metallopeptidase [Candidatus Latescibacterota bacterium]MBT5829998.1 M1 family metallopeptidase [Candidatus Latescibacterota bacterium]